MVIYHKTLLIHQRNPYQLTFLILQIDTAAQITIDNVSL